MALTELQKAASIMGRKGGPKGGLASAASLTPEQRTARAKKASDAALLARRKELQKVFPGVHIRPLPKGNE